MAASVQLASARLGETLEQCKQRYGAPIKNDGEFWEFRRNEVTIAAKIKGGKCVLLIYRFPGGFTEAQIMALANRNVPGNEGGWEEADNTSPKITATLTNPKARVAIMLFDDGDLMVTSFDAAEEQKKLADAALEGL